MALTPPSPRLFTRDLATYTDAQLDQYLEASRGDVDVEDYENLWEDIVLIQRLQTRAREQSKAQPRPIDLDDLMVRLQHASADRHARPRPPSQTGSDYRSRDTTEPLDEEEDYRLDLKRETKYYNILVSEGGRPSHPVSLGRDIVKDPGEYREILSYWQRGEDHWKMFQSQMGEWRQFREYQRKHREEGRFLTYIDIVKCSLARHGFTRPFELCENPERQDKLTTWIEFLDFEYWFYDIDMRVVKRLQPQYCEAWKELVDSQVLGPSETEEFICSIDSAFEHASERERAEQAVEATKLAVILAQNAITNPRRSALSEKNAKLRLGFAQSKLDAAVRSLESIKRRNDLVYEFYKKTQLSQITNDGKWKKSYQSAKEDAERRSILLRWIREQMPLIELELKQANVAENVSSEKTNSTSCDRAAELGEEQSSRKQERKRSHNDDATDDRLPSKRPRYNGQGSSRSTLEIIYTASLIPTRPSQESQTTASSVKLAREEQCALKSKLSTHKSSLLEKSNSSDVPQGLELRRSARISKRDERLRAAVVTPPGTVKISPRRDCQGHTGRGRLSPITPENRKSNSLAAKTAKKGRLKRGGQCGTSRPQGI